MSSSFLESALRKNVVWRDFWFVDASSLTLYCAWTCLMISPSEVGLPSLPAVDRSMDESTNVLTSEWGDVLDVLIERCWGELIARRILRRCASLLASCFDPHP